MSTCSFRSALAFRLQAFWETRSAAGRGYALLKNLRYLDQFLMGELRPGDTITREVAERFFESTAHLAIGTRINRMCTVRQVCLYLSHFDPRTCIVHRTCTPKRNRPVPHIYSRDDVRRIMGAARRCVRSSDRLRPAVFSTLVGFLYATGLRIGEAVKLDLADVDLT